MIFRSCINDVTVLLSLVSFGFFVRPIKGTCWNSTEKWKTSVECKLSELSRFFRNSLLRPFLSRT